MNAERKEQLVEALVLRSKRIRPGTSKEGIQHQWFKDGALHVPLCAGVEPHTFRHVGWGAAGDACEACEAYLAAIMAERHQRRREREAERRRERYNNDPVVRERIKANNAAYVERKNAGQPDAGEVFDEQLKTYQDKWKLDSESNDEGP